MPLRGSCCVQVASNVRPLRKAPSPLEALIKILQAEWASLTAAPWSFAIFTATTFGLAFGACRWAYQARHESVKERINLLQERLNAKDGQLDEYRERLGLLPSSGNKYSKLTHQQLQEHTLKLVHDIRTWFAQSDGRHPLL